MRDELKWTTFVKFEKLDSHGNAIIDASESPKKIRRDDDEATDSEEDDEEIDYQKDEVEDT